MPYKDPKQRAASLNAWKKQHPGKMAAYQRTYVQRHGDQYRSRKNARQKERLLLDEDFRTKRRKQNSTYSLQHPEMRRERKRRHAVRKLQAPVNDLTAAQWKAIKEHYGYRCVYCGKKTAILSQDHLTPLSKGGSHTVSNVVPACMTCNRQKYTGPVLIPVQPLLLI